MMDTTTVCTRCGAKWDPDLNRDLFDVLASISHKEARIRRGLICHKDNMPPSLRLRPRIAHFISPRSNRCRSLPGGKTAARRAG